MPIKRILSGGIAQESHSFNPVLARRDHFEVREGSKAVAEARGTNSTLGGIVDSAEARGLEVVVPAIFRAQSGGPVEDAVFDEARERMLDAARQGNFEAIALPLHGGMLTPTLSDPEGQLMRDLRAIVGPEVPITAAFDLHAHVTEETIEPVDFLAAYLTNPHGDQGSTGRRALEAAARMLEGTLEPVCAIARVPMLTLGNDRTDEEPLLGMHALAAGAVARGEVEDVSIFNAQQFLDVPELGQTVLVYGNGRSERAEALAREIAQRLWDARDELIGRYPSLEDCLARAGSPTQRTLILGDQGDRVAAGGPGDSTFVLHALLERHPGLRAIVPIADGAAVDACRAAGVGAEIALTVGGTVSRVAPAATVTGIVTAAGADAELVVEGPHDYGRRTNLGPFAVLRVGEVRVALTALPNAFLDPGYLRAMGLDPGAMDVVVVRSGYHFTLNFAGTGECITVDTPGMTGYRVAELPFKMARPFYPLHSDVVFTPRVQVRRRAI